MVTRCNPFCQEGPVADNRMKTATLTGERIVAGSVGDSGDAPGPGDPRARRVLSR